MSTIGYIGVSNISKKIKTMYVGVDGLARKVKTAYVGVDNSSRKWYNNTLLYYDYTIENLSLTPSTEETFSSETLTGGHENSKLISCYFLTYNIYYEWTYMSKGGTSVCFIEDNYITIDNPQLTYIGSHHGSSRINYPGEICMNEYEIDIKSLNTYGFYNRSLHITSLTIRSYYTLS